MEDGFVRSIGLGANHELPASLVLDKSGTLYFDSRSSSDLENILNTYDFSGDKELMANARESLNLLLNNGVSKYNHIERKSAEEIYAKYCSAVEGVKRILVIGQVESDASIKYGADRKLNNGALVSQARKDHPDAQIFFKPHPDTLAGKREVVTSLDVISQFAYVVTEPLSLVDSFDSIDELYTITSLAGFEALLRGIKVTTMGCPFYSGWGLTQDLQYNPRRTRTLTVEEVFAGAYILYPDYFDPFLPERIKLKDVLVNMHYLIEKNNSNHSLIEVKRKPVAHGILINDWKRKYIENKYPEYDWVFYKFSMSAKKVFAKIDGDSINHRIIIWGYNEDPEFTTLAKERGVSLYRMEDGFFHSIGLGFDHELPASLVLDKSGTLYFDSRSSSDLEDIFNNYDFSLDEKLLQRADNLIKNLVDNKLSKYNHSNSVNIEDIYGAKTKHRVLVIGQIENNTSIKYGCEDNLTNNDLINIAVLENPDSQILYKPHPDVINNKRKAISVHNKLKHICEVIECDIPLSESLTTIDHVYTITSLAGFEALLRGTKVTTLGCPFYSGWGLTDDRQSNIRRKRELSIQELVAGAYILYPKYFDPYKKEYITVEECIELLIRMKKVSNNSCKNNSKDFVRTDRYDNIVQCLRNLLIYEGIEDDINTLNLIKGSNEYFEVNELLLSSKGEYKELISLLDEKMIIQGATSQAYYLRAQYRLKLGELTMSTANDFKRSLSLDPTFNHRYYAYFYFMWEAFNLSEDILKQIKNVLASCSSEQKKSKAYGNLSLLYASMLSEIGKISESNLFYKKALTTNVNGKNFLPLRYKLSKASNVAKNLITDSEDKGFSKVLSEQNKFEELVLKANGSVCIVGNAPNEIGKKKGSLIDSTSLVIRFNSYSTDYPHCQDYGSKVDVWVRMPFHPYVKNNIDPNLKLIIFSGSNRINRPYPDWESMFGYVDESISLSFFNKNHFYELQSKLGCPPTSGLMMCYSLYKLIGPLHPHHYYGVSFSEQSDIDEVYHCSDSSAYAGIRHNWSNEKKIFDEICFKPGSDIITPQSFLMKKESLEKRIGNNINTISTHSCTEANNEFSIEKINGSNPLICTSKVLQQYDFNSNNAEFISPALLDNHLKNLKSEMDFKPCILGFGRSPTGIAAKNHALNYNGDYILVEYGFISSMNLPSDKKFNFSLILDDIGIFYDTTSPSRIESILNSSQEILSIDKIVHAKRMIDKIVDNNITKYNNSPDIILERKKTSHRILVIDQTENDNSIIYGQCESYSFTDMVEFALSQTDSEVILKLHPETVAGAKGGNLNAISHLLSNDKLTIIDQQCNVISLIKQVDEVYVMTSGVGFEALLAKKSVRCFGVPFYSGWGLTHDMVKMDNPRRDISIESLFAGFYFNYTMFFHPETHQRCEIDDCIEWIIENKPEYPVINLATR
ncbi:hypothetical protein BCU68_09055 [Vibrio sp. 10N.286.49.B3]|nr:hypothetical protein BCU68_09055 [Vibrio sp. 10N.286.49.B3]